MRKGEASHRAIQRTPKPVDKISNLPTVNGSLQNFSQGDINSSRFRISGQNSIEKPSHASQIFKKEITSELNDNFFDFGFHNKTRKFSERLSNSKQKVAYPGKKDITNRILDALQKEPKSLKPDTEKPSFETRSVQIKE